MAKKKPNRKGKPVVAATADPQAKPVAKSLNFVPFDRNLFPALDSLRHMRGTPYYMRSRTEIMNLLLEDGLQRLGRWPWSPPYPAD